MFEEDFTDTVTASWVAVGIEDLQVHVHDEVRVEDRNGFNVRTGPEVARETISVVIPTKNEARNIGWVLERLPEVDEVVLVDSSTDATVAAAKSVRSDIVVVAPDRAGKGAALRAGFAAATGDIIVMIDADGSMNPQEIRRFTSLLREGYDFVKGSRFMVGGGSSDITGLRRWGNRGLLGLANVLFQSSMTDLCYGYCAFYRRDLDALALEADGFEIETELILHAIKARLRLTEVPSHESPRRSGTSNLRTFVDGRRVLRTLLTEYAEVSSARWNGMRRLAIAR